MTTALIILALAIVSALVCTRRPRRTKPDGRDFAPYTRHEREDTWRARFIAEDHDYLTTACRGATAKKRMLQACRNKQACSVLDDIARRAGDRIPPPGLHTIEHYGVGPRTRREIAVRPLTSFQPNPKTVVVRRRPKLALAR